MVVVVLRIRVPSVTVTAAGRRGWWRRGRRVAVPGSFASTTSAVAIAAKGVAVYSRKPATAAVLLTSGGDLIQGGGEVLVLAVVAAVAASVVLSISASLQRHSPACCSVTTTTEAVSPSHPSPRASRDSSHGAAQRGEEHLVRPAAALGQLLEVLHAVLQRHTIQLTQH